MTILLAIFGIVIVVTLVLIVHWLPFVFKFCPERRAIHFYGRGDTFTIQHVVKYTDDYIFPHSTEKQKLKRINSIDRDAHRMILEMLLPYIQVWDREDFQSPMPSRNRYYRLVILPMKEEKVKSELTKFFHPAINPPTLSPWGKFESSLQSQSSDPT